MKTPLQIYCACHGFWKLRAFYMEENMVFLVRIQHAPNKKQTNRFAPTATNLLRLPWVFPRLSAFCMEKQNTFETFPTSFTNGRNRKIGWPTVSRRIFWEFFLTLRSFHMKTNNLRHFQHHSNWLKHCCRKVQIVFSAFCLLQPDMSCYDADDQIWSTQKDINRKDI